MFGRLQLSAPILKDALAIAIISIFGCEMNQLAKFYWECLLYHNKDESVYTINIPVLLPTNELMSRETELRDEDLMYESVFISQKYFLVLQTLIKDIKSLDNDIPKLDLICTSKR
jgi:hypothetical protein